MEYRQKNVIRLLCVVGVTLTFVLVSVLLYQFIKIGNQNKEKKKLDNVALELSQKIDKYSTSVKDIQDVNFLEDYAREAGWAQNGDIRFN